MSELSFSFTENEILNKAKKMHMQARTSWAYYDLRDDGICWYRDDLGLDAYLDMFAQKEQEYDQLFPFVYDEETKKDAIAMLAEEKYHECMVQIGMDVGSLTRKWREETNCGENEYSEQENLEDTDMLRKSAKLPAKQNECAPTRKLIEVNLTIDGGKVYSFGINLWPNLMRSEIEPQAIILLNSLKDKVMGEIAWYYEGVEDWANTCL